MNTPGPTTYTSAKVTGRTAVEDADGTLTVFQGLEIIATHDVTRMDSGEVWELINTAAVSPVRPTVKVTPQIPARISKRFDVEWYRMRGTATYRGDKVQRHARWINGRKFDFSRIVWSDGSVTVRAHKGGTTVVLHEWNS